MKSRKDKQFFPKHSSYAYKGQVHVFAGRVKIAIHSSCRTRTILKYVCPLDMGKNLMSWPSSYRGHKNGLKEIATPTLKVTLPMCRYFQDSSSNGSPPPTTRLPRKRRSKFCESVRQEYQCNISNLTTMICYITVQSL